MRTLALLALLLSSCGMGGATDPTDEVLVRRYEDVAGHVQTDPNALGCTYYIDDSTAKHGADGFNCLVNEVLFYDANPLRLRNVIVHELANVVALDHGEPDNVAPDWFLWDGDTKDDALMSFFEAGWFAKYGPYHVRVGDDWLIDATDEAVEFINASAGVAPVFERR